MWYGKEYTWPSWLASWKAGGPWRQGNDSFPILPGVDRKERNITHTLILSKWNLHLTSRLSIRGLQKVHEGTGKWCTESNLVMEEGEGSSPSSFLRHQQRCSAGRIQHQCGSGLHCTAGSEPAVLTGFSQVWFCWCSWLGSTSTLGLCSSPRSCSLTQLFE